MLLAIDVGNTNVVFALVREGVIHHHWRISTDHHRTPDEYRVWLNELFGLEGVDRHAVVAAIIATVVPATLFPLEQLCRKYFNVVPLVVGAPGVELGLKIDLPQPAEVGADRIVNAVAAAQAHKGALILVDFGTATTFDVVDERGAYIGGAIAPGVNLSMDALFAAAAKLPRIAVEPPPSRRVVGRSTIEAMQSGVFWGYIGLVEGLIARIKAEHGGTMRVIATGGLAPLFTAHTPMIDEIDHDLTIKGLYLIYQKNKVTT